MGKSNRSNSSSGCLSVVGTGPGSLEYLIPKARTVLEEADIIVGYRTYLELITPLLENKRVVSSSMMQEVDRVKEAIHLAEKGNNVVLVSGGDPGIYAMAGLAYEIVSELGIDIEINIVAGIAALNSCAERLGAPLMHDFASVSLSDLLTPWEVIEKRLMAVASADFVVVLYNPRSKKRSWQLDRAIEIMLENRSPSTPVGVVRGATRENEMVTISTLGTIDTTIVDMQSTVMIGNSSTFIWKEKMITPRGYLSKYQVD